MTDPDHSLGSPTTDPPSLFAYPPLGEQEPPTDPIAMSVVLESRAASAGATGPGETSPSPPQVIEATNDRKLLKWFGAVGLSAAILGGGIATLVTRSVSGRPATVSTQDGNQTTPSSEAPSTTSTTFESTTTTQIEINNNSKEGFFSAVQHYDKLPITPVASADPKDVVSEINKLYAIAVMDENQARADQAAKALVADDIPEVANVMLANIAAERRKNLTDRSSHNAVKFARFADPEQIAIVDSRPNYIIVRAFDQVLFVHDDQDFPPTIDDRTGEFDYYYFNVADNGTISLHSVEDHLVGWQGDGTYAAVAD